MPVTKDGTRDLFKMWLRTGLSISLHTQKPTSSGRPYILQKTRVPSGSLKINNDRLQNLRQLELGLAEFSGTARWVGVWIGNTLTFSSKLKRPVIVIEGSEVQVPRQSFSIVVEG